MLFFFPLVMLQASLFVTSSQQESWEKMQSGKMAQANENAPLILNGILYRSDINGWIVWINGQAISSSRQKSIQGWTVIRVSTDTVTVRSHTGEEKELMVEQRNEDSESDHGYAIDNHDTGKDPNDSGVLDADFEENLGAEKDDNDDNNDEKDSIFDDIEEDNPDLEKPISNPASPPAPSNDVLLHSDDKDPPPSTGKPQQPRAPSS